MNSRLNMSNTSAAGGPLMNQSILARSPDQGHKAVSLKEQAMEIEKLSKSNFNLKMRIFYLEEKLGSQGLSDSDEGFKENVNLKVSLDERTKELEQLQKVLVKARSAIEELQAKNTALEAENARMSADTVHGQGETANLRQTISDLNRRMQEYEEKLEFRAEEVTQLKSENQKMSLDLEHTRRNVEPLHRRLTQRDEECARLHADLRTLQQHIGQLNNRIAEQDHVIHEQQRQAQNVTSAQNQIQADLDELVNRCSEQERMLKDRQHVIGELQKRLREANEHIQNVLDNRDADVNVLKKQLVDMQQDVRRQNETHVSKLAEAKQHAEERVEELERRLQKQSAMLAEQDNESERIRSSYSGVVDAKSALEVRVQEWSSVVKMALKELGVSRTGDMTPEDAREVLSSSISKTKANSTEIEALARIYKESVQDRMDKIYSHMMTMESRVESTARYLKRAAGKVKSTMEEYKQVAVDSQDEARECHLRIRQSENETAQMAELLHRFKMQEMDKQKASMEYSRDIMALQELRENLQCEIAVLKQKIREESTRHKSELEAVKMADSETEDKLNSKVRRLEESNRMLIMELEEKRDLQEQANREYRRIRVDNDELRQRLAEAEQELRVVQEQTVRILHEPPASTPNSVAGASGGVSNGDNAVRMTDVYILDSMENRIKEVTAYLQRLDTSYYTNLKDTVSQIYRVQAELNDIFMNRLTGFASRRSPGSRVDVGEHGERLLDDCKRLLKKTDQLTGLIQTNYDKQNAELFDVKQNIRTLGHQYMDDIKKLKVKYIQRYRNLERLYRDAIDALDNLNTRT